MKIVLITFGRLKTPGLKEAAGHFQKMLKPWVSLEEVELKPLPVPDKNPSLRKQIQGKEAALLFEQFERHLSPRSRIYLMDERGKAQSTDAWAKQAKNWEDGSIPEVALCIGSSLGFCDSVRAKSHGSFSLGPHTLSHELARVVLLEQIYRAWSVVRGHPYHNSD